MEKQLPFDKIRILEFSQNVAGPLVGKLFADFGAEVVTIDNRAHIALRGGGRQPSVDSGNLTSTNLGFFFNKYGFNKLSMTLDMKREEGRKLAMKLAAASDIVIDNFRPDVLESWGMKYTELKKLKPDIIMLRMPTMGTGGPYTYFRSTSWLLLALAGFNCGSGFPNRMPVCPSAVSLPDVSCNPLHAAVALVGALYYRERTGKGQFIELSQFESTVSISETLNFGYLVNGKLPQRIGNRLEYAAPHGIYRCRGDDNWCAIAVFDQDEWEALCKVIEREDLIEDDRFSDLAQRLRHSEELDNIIEEWTLKRAAREVMDLLQKAEVAAGMVQNVEDLLLRDPQLRERAHWVTVEHPEAGKLVGEGWGFRFVGGAKPRFGRPPLLGEHNDYVLGQVLKIPEDDINELIIDGTID